MTTKRGQICTRLSAEQCDSQNTYSSLGQAFPFSHFIYETLIAKNAQAHAICTLPRLRSHFTYVGVNKTKARIDCLLSEYRFSYKFRFAIAKMQNQVYVIGGKTAQWPAMTQGYLFYYAGNGKQAVFRPITVLRTHFLSKG